MNRLQATQTVARVSALVDYVDAWKAAHHDYRAWRGSAWATRRARYRVQERAARRALIRLLSTLAYTPDGRVRNDTADARRRLRSFRAASDRVYARLLASGREIFGIRRALAPDPKTGLYTGSLHPSLQAEVKARLAQLMRRAAQGAVFDG